MIFLANSSSQKAGGGWTFVSNFRNAMAGIITDNYDDASVYFIAGATMVQRDEVLKAKSDGKKIVLRVDNAVRNSRNRNTGMSRMHDFVQWADLVVYQSQWARKYLMPYLGKDGPVIHNSVNTDIFNNSNRHPQDHEIYLYSRFNRDETKNWEVARYWYSRQANRGAELFIVGNYSPELIDGNFDFYNGESFKFLGVQPLEALASIYKQSNYLIYTYYNDCCSNTLIEALCCGLKLAGPEYFQTTGGAPEIISRFTKPLDYEAGLEYFGLKRMARQYAEALKGII